MTISQDREVYPVPVDTVKQLVEPSSTGRQGIVFVVGCKLKWREVTQ